jgi:hypothetical protein
MRAKNQKTHTKLDEGRQLLPVFSSMQSCEAATGIPKPVQQQAKKDGCAAFDQANRVHLEPLLRWLFRADADSENTNWSLRLKRAQALTAEMELDETKGRLVSRDQVRADMTSAASKACAIMQQKFETELPPKEEGMPAEKIADMNRSALREVRTILSQPNAYAD